MNTNDVIEDAISNGGGTYKLQYGAIFGQFEYEKVADEVSGYFVSAPYGVENYPAFAMTADVLDRIVWMRHRLSGCYLGLWKDDKGNFSIDESMWVSNLYTAIELGDKWEQRAVWDIANQREVLL